MIEAVSIIQDRFRMYYVQIYLADFVGGTLRLQAGSGVVGRQLLERRHTLPINLGSINGRAASDGKAIVVTDTTSSKDFLPNPLLPKTRSETGSPLHQLQIAILGVLNLQSDQSGMLNEEMLPVFETLAGQLAVAIENARLFIESQEIRSKFEKQAGQSIAVGWQEYLNAIDRLDHLAYSYDLLTVAPIEQDSISGSPTFSVPV
ncbi:MAG: GAF domain-containing protein, partial [Anaerolineae bacterium]|nr:GAF domain-containing protein [Anaerolineae bacterium]